MSGTPPAKANRVTRCPRCGGKLGPDKKADTNPYSGVIYRNRLCPGCGGRVHTKQPPEEITGLEPPDLAIFP